MLTSSQNISNKFNNFCLYLLVIATLIGPMIYLGVASLYHFVVLGLFLIVLYKGINTADLKTDIMLFLTLWMAEALISVLWAPDKMLALQYVYYIFLIFATCILFHYMLNNDNLIAFAHFMVILLLVCNLIAFWEMSTGNHLVKGYLSSPIRLRLLKYIPGGFYRNPNDFATFIIQIVPFSFMGISSQKTGIRVISVFNLVASFFTICATQSRTQILIILAMCLMFVLIFHKKDLIKFGILIITVAVVLYLAYPEFNNLIDNALESVSGESLVSDVASEGGSLGIRINLLKNAGHILLDTFGFGVGAGCHRAVMGEYAAMYFNTGSVRVMHNLLGELFTDYGLIVGILFVLALIRSCCSMFRIYRSDRAYNVRLLAIMLASSLGMFILCGMSSSSILQLSSVWLTVCFSSAFIKKYKNT